MSLWWNTFVNIDQYQGSVWHPQCTTDLAWKFNMSRWVNEVDHIVLLLCINLNLSFIIFTPMFYLMRIEQRYWRRFHCDHSLLLVFTWVQVPQLASEFRVDDLVRADQRVAQGCLPVINVGQYTDIADSLSDVLELAHLLQPGEALPLGSRLLGCFCLLLSGSRYDLLLLLVHFILFFHFFGFLHLLHLLLGILFIFLLWVGISLLWILNHITVLSPDLLIHRWFHFFLFLTRIYILRLRIVDSMRLDLLYLFGLLLIIILILFRFLRWYLRRWLTSNRFLWLRRFHITF